MTVRIDPRLERRRKQVREQTARGALRRLMWLAVASILVALAFWFVQSPLLALDRLVVLGADPSRVATILEEQGIELGRPLLAVRPGRLEEALLDDPWIAAARVSVVIPDTLEIELTEREEAGWVMGPRPSLIATDGVVLQVGGTPEQDANVIDLGSAPGRPGEVHPDPAVVGAVEFLGAVAEVAEGPVRVTEVEGELWARLGGIDVRLGRPVEMQSKAAALLATLAQEVEEGSTIVLLAPTRPAVLPPSGPSTPTP